MPNSPLAHGQRAVGHDHLKTVGRHHGLIPRLMPETHAPLVIKPDGSIRGGRTTTHLTTSPCQTMDVDRLPRMPFTVSPALGIWKTVPRVGIDEGKNRGIGGHLPGIGKGCLRRPIAVRIRPKHNHGFHLPGSKVNAQDVNSVGYRAGGGLQAVADPEVLEVWGCRRPCLGCCRDEIRGEQEMKDQDKPDFQRGNRTYPSHDLLITDFIGT